MLRLKHTLLIRAYLILDQLVLIGVALGIICWRPDLGGKTLVTAESLGRSAMQFSDFCGIVLLGTGWVIIYLRCVRYTGERFTIMREKLRNSIIASTLASFWLLLISNIFDFRSMTTPNVLVFWTIVTVIGLITRFLMRGVLMSFRKSGYNHRYLVIIGANDESRLLVDKIRQQPVLGYRIVGFVAEDESQKQSFEASVKEDYPVIGLVADLKELLKDHQVDEIIVCFSVEARFKDAIEVMHCAKDLGIVMRVLPNAEEAIYLKGTQLERFDGRTLVTFFRQQLLIHLLLKRVMDIVLSGIGLLVLSPLFALVAVWIKLTDRGPIFFSQDRVGMNNRHFKMHKFRSMVVNAEELKENLAAQNEHDEGPVFKIKNDPRVTPVGRFLRKFSIDELPQLWNVFVGEMSLVGPRPPLPKEVDGYEWKFRRRLSIPQGITCLWQVSGRDEVGFREWMDLDSKYIDNWSIWLDMKILLLTIPAVLMSRGAS